VVGGLNGGEQAGQLGFQPPEGIGCGGVGRGRGAGLLIHRVEAPPARDDHDVGGHGQAEIPVDSPGERGPLHMFRLGLRLFASV
jgi:hypothetical protein